jgi:arsenite methyltransferase
MIGYEEAILSLLPESVQAVYCGVGNPFSLGAIGPGMTVIDIGCGVCVDTLFAALMVGPGGRVVGIDITQEMVERAKANLRQVKLLNVSFYQASAEQFDFFPKALMSLSRTGY